MANIGDILRVIASLRVAARATIQNVYYLRVAGNYSNDDVADDAGHYLERVYNSLITEFPNDLRFEEYKVSNITAGIELGTFGFPTYQWGLNPGQFLPEGIAGLVIARTQTPGRFARKYFGPFVEDSLVDGQLNSLAVQNLTEAGVGAYSPYQRDGRSYVPVVYDRVNGVSRIPVSVVAYSTPAYQRRRRPGTGL